MIMIFSKVKRKITFSGKNKSRYGIFPAKQPSEVMGNSVAET